MIKHFNKQSCSFLRGYPLVLKTDDRFWNAFPICRYSFCNAVGLKAEFQEQEKDKSQNSNIMNISFYIMNISFLTV